MVQVPCGFYIPAVSEELKEDIGAGWELVIRKDNPWPAREPLGHLPFKIVPTMQQNVCLTQIESHIFRSGKPMSLYTKGMTLLRTCYTKSAMKMSNFHGRRGGSDFNTKDLLKALDLEHLI